MSANAAAWAVACAFFEADVPRLASTLTPKEREAIGALPKAAVRPVALDHRVALCPYCQLQTGPVVAKSGPPPIERLVECPDCGPVLLTAEDVAAIRLDDEWMLRGLRLALEIASDDAIEALADGIWRLGNARRAPVLVARRIEAVWRMPAILDRVRVAGSTIRLITPRPHGLLRGAPFGEGVHWWPLEERFTLYAGRITHIAPPGERRPPPADPAAPVHGPFSKDFRHVRLDDWADGPILLTAAQAAVFEALWSFKGEPRTAEAVIQRAGIRSGKPIDVFKIKKQHRGDPAYEGPLLAYQRLVQTRRRDGLYWMPCAVDPGHGNERVPTGL